MEWCGSLCSKVGISCWPSIPMGSSAYLQILSFVSDHKRLDYLLEHQVLTTSSETHDIEVFIHFLQDFKPHPQWKGHLIIFYCISYRILAIIRFVFWIFRCSRYLVLVRWQSWLIAPHSLVLLCIYGITQVSSSIRISVHMARWLGDTLSWARRYGGEVKCVMEYELSRSIHPPGLH